MLNVLGNASRLCDGTTRRQLLQAGAISTLGLSLPNVLQAEAATTPRGGSAKAVILVNLLGGPSHIDMFDVKPDAPSDVRGEFKPIATSLPGYQVCEHLPLTARLAHRSTVIRTHAHLYNTHSPYNMLTGYSGPVVDGNAFKPTDHPSIGAVMQHAGMVSDSVPPYVWMPSHPGHSQSKRRAGPYGGFLGSKYDPLFTIYDEKFDLAALKGNVNVHDNPPVPRDAPRLLALDRLPEVSLNRLNLRQSLLQQLDQSVGRLQSSSTRDRLTFFKQKAFDLLTSSKTRDAFDISKEPESVRRHYGKNLFGSCMLTARRLVESGVRFVGVTTESSYKGGVGAGQWDTHSNNFGLLKNFNLPTLDRNYSALIEDLDQHGLLDSTLVVLMGEMGRTPRVKKNGGRDHWTQCGFIVLTGGGVKQGMLYGQSDDMGAFPIDNPVSSADYVATIYQLLGLDPHMTISDLSGRPVSIAFEGRPISEVIA